MNVYGPASHGRGAKHLHGGIEFLLEFVAHAVNDWCWFNDTGSLFIDPGSPWQNAGIESFNDRLRDELLNSWRFDSLRQARVIIRRLALHPKPDSNRTTKRVPLTTRDIGALGKTISNKHAFLSAARKQAAEGGHIAANFRQGLRLPRSEAVG